MVKTTRREFLWAVAIGGAGMLIGCGGGGQTSAQQRNTISFSNDSATIDVGESGTVKSVTSQFGITSITNSRGELIIKVGDCFDGNDKGLIFTVNGELPLNSDGDDQRVTAGRVTVAQGDTITWLPGDIHIPDNKVRR